MRYRTALFAIGASLLGLTSTSNAQSGGDPTTPPAGVPSKVMKTLDEVEARIPLVDGAPGVTKNANGGFTISQSNSYYLTENISISSGDGIVIDATYVTLDLNGYFITRFSPSDVGGYGIRINDSFVTVSNGFIISPFSGTTDITGLGFDTGVYADDFDGVFLKNLSVRGAASDGIRATRATVEDCFVDSVGRYGIFLELAGGNFFLTTGIIKNSQAINCEDTAMNAVIVLDSLARSITGDGIVAVTVSNSFGSSDSSGNGIFVSGGTIQNSSGSSSSGSGIDVTNETVITGSRGLSSSAAGISADSNSLVKGSIGISESGTVGISSTTPVIDSISQPAI